MRGFTLIETVIYIALYALIIGGIVVSVYALIESSGQNKTKAMVHEEGLFILSKIENSLTNADSVASADPSTISIIDSSLPASSNPTIFSVSSGAMSVARGNNPKEILNNSNTKVANPSFAYTKESGDGTLLESVRIEFTLETLTAHGKAYSENFATTIYLRK